MFIFCKDNANERNESLLSNCRMQIISANLRINFVIKAFWKYKIIKKIVFSSFLHLMEYYLQYFM